MSTILNSLPLKTSESQSLPLWMERHGWLLIVGFLLLQPLRHSFELSMAIMACLGLWLVLFRRSMVMALPALKPLLIMFACIWFPMLFSLTDPVFLQRAAKTTLVFLRFPLAAIFIICVLKNSEAKSRLLKLFVLGISLAGLSAVMLTLTGYSADGRVNAGFPIGHIMAVLSPIYLYWLWCNWQQKKWALLFAPIFIMAILFSGARVSWIMLIVGLLLLMLQTLWTERILWSRKKISVLVLLVIVGLTGAISNHGMKAKLANTMGLFSGNYELANAATSLRLPIWSVAIKVAEDHWINGIGPRGFRYIYPQYVPKDDFWMTLKTVDRKTGKLITTPFGPTHPHQLFLEIAVETGMIGVLCYLAALMYWVRLWLGAARSQITQALPWMSAVFIAIMPINAHMAFYASFWSCITWWLIAVSLAFWQTEKNSR